MFLRATVFPLLRRPLAVSFTTVGLLTIPGVTARAASFDLSYTFNSGTAFSALINGEANGESGNGANPVAAVGAKSSARSGKRPTSYIPSSLAFSASSRSASSRLASQSDAPALGQLEDNGLHELGLSLFETDGLEGLSLSFTQRQPASNQASVRIAEAFNYGGYSLTEKVPENMSVPVLLTGLAGMGLAVAKRHTH